MPPLLDSPSLSSKKQKQNPTLNQASVLFVGRSASLIQLVAQKEREGSKWKPGLWDKPKGSSGMGHLEVELVLGSS